jgi:hypothetical protein
LEGSKNRPGKEDPMAGTGAVTRDPEPAANTLKSSPNPGQTAEPSSPEPSEDHTNPEVTTPEQEARRESEERIRGLLKAYQQTLDTVEELPVVVWVPWDHKGPGRYVKVPYLRLFLTYFVEYHIGRSLDTLNRRFYATAALSSDPDANRSNREAVQLYLQSLPSPPYGILIFAAVLAALVIALPLQGFGNVFYVLDLVGAMLRANVSYVDRALEGKDLGPTVRSLAVLLVGLIGVGALLTSPFGLKRIYSSTCIRGPKSASTRPRPGATVSGSKDSTPWKTASSKRLASGVQKRGGGTSRPKPSCSRSCWYSGSSWRA